MSDLISRQVAIELIHSLYPSAPIMPMNRKRWEKKYKPYIEAEKALEMLPSIEGMTPEEFKNEMQRIRGQLDNDYYHCDPEITHSEADDLMCKLLRTLGYGEGVDIFEDMPKWYA